MTDQRVYRSADALIAGRQFEEARQLLRGVLAEDPTDGAALLLLARTDAEAGDDASARASAMQAANIPHLRPEASLLLARLASDDTEAVRWTQEAVRLAPDEWRYRSMLAAALANVGRHGDAIAQAEAGVEMAPQDPDTQAWALTALGYALAASPGQRKHGVEVMRRAAALDPTDPAIAHYLAFAQFQAGQRAGAIETALRVLRVTPTERSLPLLSATALFLLVRRALSWLIPVVWIVPIVFIGFLSSVIGLAPASRLGGAVGLALVGVIVTLDLSPLREASIRRSVWRVARRRPVMWVVLTLIGISVICYLAALVLGWFGGVAWPAFVVTLAYIIHSYSALALRPKP